MEQKPASSIRLYYFDLPGRAEHIRYMFAYKGLKYEDIRVKGTWEELKPKTPFGSLPVLEIDGHMIGQSLATGRLAAKLSGLYGNGIAEEAQIDSLVETINELRETTISVHYTKNEEEKMQKKKTFIEEKIPKVMSALKSFLRNNRFLVNDKLTWADIHFLAVCEVLIFSGLEEKDLCLDDSLKKLMKRLQELPAIADYKNKHPISEPKP